MRCETPHVQREYIRWTPDQKHEPGKWIGFMIRTKRVDCPLPDQRQFQINESSKVVRSLKISTLEGGASGSKRCDLDDLGYYTYCIINVREDGAPVCWIDG